MQEVDWDLVRFNYEALGRSISDLAKEFDVPETVVTYASRENKWKRIPLEELQQRKAEYLTPRYFALETTLLSKAMSMAVKLDPEKPAASSTLKTLVGVLKDLIASNPEMGGGDGNKVYKWEIEIVEPSTTSGATETGPIPHNQKAL